MKTRLLKKLRKNFEAKLYKVKDESLYHDELLVVTHKKTSQIILQLQIVTHSDCDTVSVVHGDTKVTRHQLTLMCIYAMVCVMYRTSEEYTSSKKFEQMYLHAQYAYHEKKYEERVARVNKRELEKHESSKIWYNA